MMFRIGILRKMSLVKNLVSNISQSSSVLSNKKKICLPIGHTPSKWSLYFVVEKLVSFKFKKNHSKKVLCQKKVMKWNFQALSSWYLRKGLQWSKTFYPYISVGVLCIDGNKKFWNKWTLQGKFSKMEQLTIGK